MKVIKFLLVSISSLVISLSGFGENVRLSNDTLYCNLSYDEVGTLKSQTSSIADLNVIKTLVIGGYISQSDEDFIHSLGKSYSLENLDMTDLYSTMSYEGLEGCTKIKTVKYSKHWTATVQYLFEDCTNLNTVIFPDGNDCALTTFSSGTFRGCTSLETITIPKSIKLIDSQSFYICPNLKEIHCLSGIAPITTIDAFGDQFDTATIYVPKGATLNYKTSAGWCAFKNFVEDNTLTYEPSDIISEHVYLSNDTLYSDLAAEEAGSIKASVIKLTSDMSIIKTVVLSGYINENDASFLNALSSSFNLEVLDFTNLRSIFNSRAFQGCSKIKTITYSRYWSSTGWYLFEDCSSLRNVVFPDNYIDNGITEFTTGTFRGCSSLEEITIPKTVQNIGSQCFYICNALKTIKVKAVNPPVAGESSFGGQMDYAKLIVPKGTITDYKTSAGWNLFNNIEEDDEDTAIAEKELSDNVSVSEGVLYCNMSMSEVGRLKATVLSKYPDVNSITKAVISGYINTEDSNFLNALASTYNLADIDFTSLYSSFGSFAFQGCTKLSSVKYSQYWNSTGWYLFEDCTNLSDVQFPTTSEGDGITTFETGSFRGCSSLEEILIPANVTTIGSQCFYLCYNLKKVQFLGNAIKSIDKGAFESCYSLETLIMPSSMTLIGERCFEGCTNIKEIHCDSQTPPEVAESSFEDIYSSAVLYVPQGCKAKYSAAPVWKNFLSIVESAPTAIENVQLGADSNLIDMINLNGMSVNQGVVGGKVGNLSNGIYIFKSTNSTNKVVVK